jgi:hypothetical protein
MNKSKYQVNDEVVFLTDSYNKGVRFTITQVLVTYSDIKSSENTYSYRLENGIQNFIRKEEDLYWIPTGTIDRSKESNG